MNTIETMRPTPRLFHRVVLTLLGALGANAAQAVTADDVACSGCVNTADIAGGAVTSGKIANNTITGDDVASEALTKNDILDEAGLDMINHAGTGYYASLSPTLWLPQQQITITHPAPGWVWCTAQGAVKWNVNSSALTGYIGWSDSSANNVAPAGYAVAQAVGTSTNGALLPIASMRAFLVVGSGSKTFYLKGKASSGANGNLGYYIQSAACMYFPTQL